MAKLISVDGEHSMILKPCRLEEEDEGWILSHLILEKHKVKILEITGAFLCVDDYCHIIDGVNKVIGGVVTNTELRPIEPNFYFKMTVGNNSEFEIECSYCEQTHYENGHIVKKDSMTKKQNFTSDREGLTSFLNQLSMEITEVQEKRA